MKNKEITPAPWERQPDETPTQYEAFCVYRDLKDIRDPQSTRTIPQVSAALNKSVGLLSRWSAKNDWVKRTAAWDDEQERIVREEEEKQRIEDIRKMRKRHADLGNAMLIKAAKAMQRIPDDEVNAAALARLVEVGSKLERISRGDVGEVVEERDGGQTAPAVTFYMPDNGRDTKEPGDEE